MFFYLLRRLLQSVPVILGVIFAVMLTIEMIPGDPVTLMLGEHATQESVAAVREALGLDKPLLVRYAQYIGNLLHGELGRSIRERRLVSQELADVWPATLELTAAALIIAVVCGVLAGGGLGRVAELLLRWCDAAGLAVRSLPCRSSGPDSR